MSMELYVALPTKEPISNEAVVEEARRLGLDLAFADGVVFDRASGFQPGTLGGERAGVEIDLFEPATDAEIAEMFNEASPEPARIVAFRWGGDHMECAFAMAVAASLVGGRQGICFDPEEGAFLALDRIVAIANDAVTWGRNDAGGAEASP